MKLLIITQKVDRSDPILGFFHGWIRGFAERCEQVTVVGQFVGKYDLPANVTMVSLEKENGASLVSQVLRFWKLIIAHRRSYDRVLVHMVPIWIVLGAPIWFLLRKPMYLWYEARGKRWPLRVALLFVRKIFSASPSGMPLRSAKSVITGHGIDTDLYNRGSAQHEPKFLVTVGRITASKHLDVLLHALELLGPDYQLTIVGETITDDDRRVRADLDRIITARGLRVDMSPLPPEEVTALLRRADVFLHASETSLDKAVLEAMACGCPVVSTSPAFKDLPIICQAVDSESLAEHVGKISAMNAEERKELAENLRKMVVEKHGLTKLIDRLMNEMKS